MPRKSQTTAFEPRQIMISGISYERLMMATFKIKPTSERKRGFGYQKIYTLTSRQDLIDFTDHFLDRAADFADKYGDDHPQYLQMVKDASKL